MIGFRIGAGVRHTLTGCLGRVLPGRPCRGIVTVLFDGDAAAQTVPARSLRLVADRYSAAKAWQAFVSTPR